MLALMGNLSFTEVLVVLVVALLVFGKRLPEVAVRASSQFVKARRTLTEMWRQTGLEDELRRVRREIESEQRRIEASLPEWRKELPDWKKLEGDVRRLESDVSSAEPPKPSTEAPAGGATQGQEGGPIAISPLRDKPAPSTASGAPPAAPAPLLDPARSSGRTDGVPEARVPEAPPAREESV